jgi:hypothetical protein
LSAPIINREPQEQTTEPKATVSDSGACQADHQPSSCLHSCLWCVALPLHYIAGGLVRVLPAVLAFIMLGGTCKLPPISYPHCSSNWERGPSWSNPVIEALAMTLLLCILCRNVYRHLQHLYYFSIADMIRIYEDEASKDGACCKDGACRGCSWSKFKSGWGTWSRGVISAWVRLFCIGFATLSPLMSESVSDLRYATLLSA